MSSIRYLIEALVQKGTAPLAQLQQLVLQDSARISTLEGSTSTTAATYLAAMGGTPPASWLGWFAGKLRLTAPAGAQPYFQLASSAPALQLTQSVDATSSTVQATTGTLTLGTSGGGLLVEADGDVVLSKDLYVGGVCIHNVNAADYTALQFTAIEPSDAPYLELKSSAGALFQLGLLTSTAAATNAGLPLNSARIYTSYPLYIASTLYVPALYVNGVAYSAPAAPSPTYISVGFSVDPSNRWPYTLVDTVIGGAHNFGWDIDLSRSPGNGEAAAFKLSLTSSQMTALQNAAQTVVALQSCVPDQYGYQNTGASLIRYAHGALLVYHGTDVYLAIRTTDIAWATISGQAYDTGYISAVIKIIRPADLQT